MEDPLGRGRWPPTAGWPPTGDQWSLGGRRQSVVSGSRSLAVRQATSGPFFSIFSFCNIIFCNFFKALVCSKSLGFFGGVHLQQPHFLKLVPTFGSVESSIPHGEWRFHFFPKKKNSKFRVHIDLYIHRWDFGFNKK
jgi:hypothetical protein